MRVRSRVFLGGALFGLAAVIFAAGSIGVASGKTIKPLARFYDSARFLAEASEPTASSIPYLIGPPSSLCLGTTGEVDFKMFLDLPPGAQITMVKFWYQDDDATDPSAHLRFSVEGLNGTEGAFGPDVLGTATSTYTGVGEGSTPGIAAISNPTAVDESTEDTALKVVVPECGGSYLQMFSGATVFYTLK